MEPPEHLGEYTTLIARIRQDDARTAERRGGTGAGYDDTGNECGRPPLPGSRLRRVTDYVKQNLDKDLTLAELAAVVYMSPSHFARLFKCSTGLSPHRLVIRQRIARAEAFLATQESSIAQISRMAGFRTPSHFTTVFRRVLGTTPGAYRKALRKRAGTIKRHLRGGGRSRGSAASPVRPGGGPGRRVVSYALGARHRARLPRRRGPRELVQRGTSCSCGEAAPCRLPAPDHPTAQQPGQPRRPRKPPLTPGHSITASAPPAPRPRGG
jgi:AraC-like DNA-binding protein